MNTKAIEVIRHSLNAASAALALLDDRAEPVQATVQTVVEAAPVQAAEVVDTPVPNNYRFAYDKIMAELNGDYCLRTISELVSDTGYTITFIKEVLDANNEDYVTKTRRSDSAPLIGLESRN